MKVFPLVFAAAVTSQLLAGVPAFPGAEGWGKDATGGRDQNTKILFVTSLDDSGPGTLREALMQSGPRIILFKTGGIIDLQSSISFREGDVTIAGQTAPGDGIIIRNHPIRIGASNVIMRGIRIRNGDGPGPVGDLRDSLQVGRVNSDEYVHDIVVDHCSFGWSMDETAEFWYGSKNVTLSYNIFSEALWNSQHPKGKHGYAMLFGERPNNQVSVHHNLFAHNERRNPWVKDNAQVEVVNNVVYNWGTEATGVWLGTKAAPIFVNIIGNFYKPGADTHARHLEDRQFVDLHAPAAPGSLIYVANNAGMGRTSADDPWDAVWTGKTPDPTSFRSETVLKDVASGMPIEKPELAYEQVLASAGAWPRDSADRRAVEDTRNGTGDRIDTMEEIGGYPEYARGSYPTDSDNDGMPDQWERRKGLNPRDAADATKLAADGSGYLNLEQYINSLLPTAKVGVIADVR